MGPLPDIGSALRLMMWLAGVGAIVLLAVVLYGIFWLVTHVRFI